MTRESTPHETPDCALTVEDARLLLHELRAPMTAIIGYSGMLRGAHSDQERIRIVEGLERAVTRMDAMLESASLGTFKPKPLLGQTRRIDLGAFTQEAVADMRASSAVEIGLDQPADVSVTGDPLLLRRALDNLLSNAVRYGADSPIGVRVAREAALAVIEVADRGPGIPEEDLERMMRPLERLDRDASTPGTGLGLSIVADIVSAHGGRATLAEREGGGTVARIELPAKD